MTNVDVNRVHTKAMLVCLSISNWTGKKLDRGVTNEIHSSKKASDDAGQYTKRLFGKQKDFLQITKTASRIRQEHYVKTLPWTDDGWRLLPTESFLDYTDWLRDSRDSLRKDVERFLSIYDDLRENAKSALGELYNESDYPSRDELKSRFGIHVQYRPLPVKGDFRVDLPAEHLTQIENETQKHVANSIKCAMQDAWNRLHTVVSKVHERLDDEDKIFRDSLIENAREMCSILKSLNITNDPKLEEMRKRVESEITLYEPGMLRINSDARKEVADQAKDIMKKMQQYENIF